MGLFKRLAGLFTPSASQSRDNAYWVIVRCKRCGETLRARINLHNDLSVNYGEGEADTTYFVRKTLMGTGRCFQRVEVELTFDKDRNLMDRKITGGEFIDSEADPEASL
jgi:hypothetical protein